MKKQNIISILILILFSIIITSFKPEEKISKTDITNTPPYQLDSFIIGMLGNGQDTVYSRLVNDLGLNLWHTYQNWFNIYEWNSNIDELNAPLSQYKGLVTDRLVKNTNNGMKTLYDREKLMYMCFGQSSKLMYMCFGQSSIYECEEEQNIPNQDLKSYTYAWHSSNTGVDFQDNQYNNGKYVRYSSVGLGHQAGYVVKDLKANREQINIHDTWGRYAVDSQYDWYVKPRIRIDSTIAYQLPPIEICRIEVYDANGDSVKKITIFSNYFVDINGVYSGEYLEEFNIPSSQKNLIIHRLIDGIFNPDSIVLWDTSFLLFYGIQVVRLIFVFGGLVIAICGLIMLKWKIILHTIYSEEILKEMIRKELG